MTRTPEAAAGAPLPRAAVNSDADLIGRVLAGRVDDYGLLVHRHQDTLYRVAWSMVHDSDVAADLVQDVFVRAYVNLGSCRDTERFRVWILVMLRNRCLDYLKERRRADVSLQDLKGEPPGRSGSPLSSLSERAEIDRALGTLPDSLREAFLLRHVEDLDYEEIADVLGTSVAGSKMRVSRARDLLRKALSQAADADSA
jgi:RNA polymerase sigma-70 factor, ECF subfamily